MDFTRRYNRLVWATAAAVVLVSLGLLLVQLRTEYDHEVRLIGDEFRERSLNLENIVKNTTDHVDALQLTAQNYLTVHPTVASSTLFNQIGPGPDGSYNLDGVRAPYQAGMIGNLTGTGALTGRDPAFYREMEMALGLNPLFQITAHDVPNTAWIYYTSQNNFINIYPWTPANKFQFTPDLYTHDFYTGGQPQANPSRQRFWTTAYIDEAGKGLMVTCAAPVYEGDTFRGTVAMDFTLDVLNNFVKNFTYDKGVIFLVNEQGQVLAHPTQVSSSDKAVRSMSETFAPDLQGALTTLFAGRAMDIQTTNSYLLFYQRVDHAPWKLVFLARQQDIVLALVGKVGAGAAVLLLGLALMILITNRLTRREFVGPAVRLVEHIQTESTKGPTPLPPVPTPWLPWFTEVSRLFAQNRALLAQVEQRERRLKQEVQDLRIEIDQVKQTRQVAEITETEYFQELEQRARDLRSRTRNRNGSAAVAAAFAPATNGAVGEEAVGLVAPAVASAPPLIDEPEPAPLEVAVVVGSRMSE